MAAHLKQITVLTVTVLFILVLQVPPVDVSGAANTTVLAGNIKNVGVAGGLTKEGEGTLKIGLDLTNYKEA
jgi:hypothetical protein